MSKQPFLMFLVIVLIVAGLLFYDQVLNVFRGMTVLEAMRQIATFVLHVIVVTILGYVVVVANEIMLPWIRTFRRKQRTARRMMARGGRIPVKEEGGKMPGVPRGNKDRALLWMIQQMTKPQPRPSIPPSPQPSPLKVKGEERIKLDF